jgi:hypothetical protein
MAKVIVEGTITRTIPDRGFVVSETYTTKAGEPRETKYTVWLDNRDNIPADGTRVKVEGNFSARLERFTNSEGKQIEYVANHVNQPQVTIITQPNEFAPNLDVPF